MITSILASEHLFGCPARMTGASYIPQLHVLLSRLPMLLDFVTARELLQLKYRSYISPRPCWSMSLIMLIFIPLISLVLISYLKLRWGDENCLRRMSGGQLKTAAPLNDCCWAETDFRWCHQQNGSACIPGITALFFFWFFFFAQWEEVEMHHPSLFMTVHEMQKEQREYEGGNMKEYSGSTTRAIKMLFLKEDTIVSCCTECKKTPQLWNFVFFLSALGIN